VATFSRIPLEEAQRSALPPRRAVQEQYRQYVRGLTGDVAGRIELGEGEKSITERARLKAAAKAEGLNLEIKRQGNALVFWLSEEAVASNPGSTRRKGSR
jgi:hypothetical protein